MSVHGVITVGRKRKTEHAVRELYKDVLQEEARWVQKKVWMQKTMKVFLKNIIVDRANERDINLN